MKNKKSLVQVDERMVQVANKGQAIGFAFVTFALLIDVMYRSFVKNEASWDLMAIVIVGGLISTFYQLKQKALPQNYGKLSTLIAVCSALLSVAILLIILYLK